MQESQVPTTSPCRLFVYLARDTPVAVVLRRGPSAWARLSVWHTDSDTFEHGQWFRGRVFERRSDLSADGSLFVYFARKEGPVQATDRRDSRMAISRPPYFTALALWFVGGTYWLGGLFYAARAGQSLFIGGATDVPDQGEIPPWLSLVALPPHLDRTPNATERTVHFNRLLRDGWVPVPSIEDPKAHWERRQPGGFLVLMMLSLTDADFRAYGGPHVVEYAVRRDSEDDLVPLGRATWADWDHRGRLVIAQAGRLLHWQGPDVLDQIADFNGMVPDPARAPEWAYNWPRRR